jgi:hypothetical protein
MGAEFPQQQDMSMSAANEYQLVTDGKEGSE